MPSEWQPRLGSAATACMLKHNLRPLVLEKLPLLALAAASCAVTVWAQGSALTANEKYSFWWRIGHVPVAYVGYLIQFFHPVDLAVPYPRPAELPLWQVSGALLVLALVTAAAVAGRRRFPYLLVGWLWYLGMLLPAIGLVQFGVQATADRFTYLPQIGLGIALAWGLADACLAAARGGSAGCACYIRRWRGGCRRVRRCPDGVCVASDDFLARQRNALDTCPGLHLEQRPGARQPGQRIGRSRTLGRGHEAVRGGPGDRSPLCRGPEQLGQGLGRPGPAGGRNRQYRRAIAADPKCAEAHYNLADALAARGRLEEAVAQYAEAVAAPAGAGGVAVPPGRGPERPGRGDGRFGPGRRGDPALRGGPASPARLLRGPLQPRRRPGRTGAIRRGDPPVSRGPDGSSPTTPTPTATWAWPWPAAANPAEAMAEYREALRIKPDCAEALGNLAAAYAEAGRLPEAVAAFREALELATRQKNQALADGLRARLAEYEGGGPAVQQPPPSRAGRTSLPTRSNHSGQFATFLGTSWKTRPYEFENSHSRGLSESSESLNSRYSVCGFHAQ